ncbi:MAG TPA: CpaF family protein [Acidimicrobiales bacterium]|nr:CpaF family protein [Acidimicrobiales bacterium]
MSPASSPAKSLSGRLHQAHGTPERRRAALDELRRRTHDRLIDDLGPELQDDRVSEEELRFKVRERLGAALRGASLSAAEKAEVVQDVSDDILGYGPISRYLDDETVTEVMVNGPAKVYVERGGKIERVAETFLDEDHLRRIIDKIVSQVGRRVDESTPMVDARLPDGSRVNAVTSPLAVGGPFLTIRKFSADALQMDDLIRLGALTEEAAAFLAACVDGRMNIIVSGGTGSGKTTTLNALSSAIGPEERIVTIEDAKELQLQQEHVLSMEARPPNIEGRGAVTIRDLVRNALRMRPDRIIVGEVRGGEALDMLQAMNTGHDGSLTTVHSNGPRDTLARVETMALMAGLELPVRAIRDQMASALDLFVHLGRLRDGTRRVTHITEVQALEGDVMVLQDLFLFDFGMGLDSTGRFRGWLKPTGLRPGFLPRLEERGIRVNERIFRSGTPVRRASARR